MAKQKTAQSARRTETKNHTAAVDDKNVVKYQGGNFHIVRCKSVFEVSDSGQAVAARNGKGAKP